MPRTSMLVDINQKLFYAQHSRIMETPFQYLVDMKTYITMNDNLLRELLHRSDASSLGFRVGVRTIAIKHLQVCLALGLHIVEDPLSKLIDRDNHCRTLFDVNEVINVKSVHSKLMVLQDGENIEDICRVYILFAL